ncbi:DNA integrity scanning protein disA [Halalkalibacter akibai JCM 9157]|uniref:DNA integrity scanning protein disA n=1 Tax=Halalkalibacter akibai (strain ATCC 43226 / DSM 21942 / CIP 109018 / JCM 9157 / 1139) TaxID=1236973 RepID=W4QVD2_HALA3|nr:DNA integrity scanning protein disA [Halalkalibacter akibai JCM 9157]
MGEGKKRYAFIQNVLKLVAPGTDLRAGIDNVLRAKTGGLIVIGYDNAMIPIVDGGFLSTVIFLQPIFMNLQKWMEL